MVPNVVWLQKLAPKVYKKTWSSFLGEVTSNIGLYGICVRKFVGKYPTKNFRQVWENLGKNPSHSQNFACSYIYVFPFHRKSRLYNLKSATAYNMNGYCVFWQRLHHTQHRIWKRFKLESKIQTLPPKKGNKVIPIFWQPVNLRARYCSNFVKIIFWRKT